MRPTSKLRRLFQALSVLSAITCMLLIVLWVQSYERLDAGNFVYSASRQLLAVSIDGGIILDTAHALPGDGKRGEWRYASQPVKSLRRVFFDENGNYSGKGVVVPYSIQVLLTASLAAAPWIKYRFSLRALLTATTLVAGILGMAVALKI